MAHIIRDSFDFYSTVNDAQTLWSVMGGTGTSLVRGRFLPGQAFAVSSSAANINLQYTSSGNVTTWFIHVSVFRSTAFSGSSAQSVLKLVLRDAATDQMAIHFREDGAIETTRGSVLGTNTVDTWTSAWVAQTWTHFEIKVVINNSTGSIEFRKDGATSADHSASSLNIRATSNNFAQTFQVVSGTHGVTSIGQAYLDDLWVYDDSGSAPNGFIGDVRAIPLMPNADTADADFTPLTSGGTAGTTITGGNSGTINADTIYWEQFVAPIGGLLSGSVTVNVNTALTGKAKLAIYDSDAYDETNSEENPKTLLTTSNEVTNPGTGNQTFTFASPPTLRKGRKYFWAMLIDTTRTTFLTTDTTTGSHTRFTASNTYVSGFPTTAPTLTRVALQRDFTINTSIASSHFGNVNEDVQDGATSYVQSSNIADVDLYNLFDLASTPTSIFGVSVRSVMAKSDAGARGGQVEIKSGSTVTDLTAKNLSTTFTHYSDTQDTDPDTSAAWTATGVNSLKIGPKVAS